jgi:phosphoribosylglycinamide formyltransferase-1
MKPKVAILISGRGSNMVALVEAMQSGRVDAEPVLVLSNKESAAGLQKAAEMGVPTQVIEHRGFPTREAHEEKVIEAIRGAGAEWICLAGYMRILSPLLVRAFENRILNIHPALLPAFPGLDAQTQAWEWGAKVSGVTVHLVDEEMDHGPIILQKTVPVLDGDTAHDLAERILAEEHEAYAEALGIAVSGRWRLEGRRVVVEGE